MPPPQDVTHCFRLGATAIRKLWITCFGSSTGSSAGWLPIISVASVQTILCNPLL